MSADFRIISLCGSAGALSAYVDFLRMMPDDRHMAYVVLTHRRKDTPCFLVEILSQVTAMQVEEIVDGTILQPDRVYVIPAGQDLTIEGEAFHLVPATTVRGWPNAFDIYLESLAAETSGRAVTIILSGMASDGSAFLRALRDGGGLNYAQAEAATPSMPRSAIATGMIDYVGSPQQIAQAVLSLPSL